MKRAVVNQFISYILITSCLLKLAPASPLSERAKKSTPLQFPDEPKPSFPPPGGAKYLPNETLDLDDPPAYIRIRIPMSSQSTFRRWPAIAPHTEYAGVPSVTMVLYRVAKPFNPIVQIVDDDVEFKARGLTYLGFCRNYPDGQVVAQLVNTGNIRYTMYRTKHVWHNIENNYLPPIWLEEGIDKNIEYEILYAGDKNERLKPGGLPISDKSTFSQPEGYLTSTAMNTVPFISALGERGIYQRFDAGTPNDLMEKLQILVDTVDFLTHKFNMGMRRDMTMGLDLQKLKLYPDTGGTETWSQMRRLVKANDAVNQKYAVAYVSSKNNTAFYCGMGAKNNFFTTGRGMDGPMIHEYGHHLGMLDCYPACPSLEGRTGMCGNWLNRYSSAEVSAAQRCLDVWRHAREKEYNIEDPADKELGAEVPPYVRMDTVVVDIGEEVEYDVMKNDYDGDRDDLTLHSIQEPELMGLELEPVFANGDGRDKVRIKSYSHYGNDMIEYGVVDTTGRVGYGILNVVAQAPGKQQLYLDFETATSRIIGNRSRFSDMSGADSLIAETRNRIRSSTETPTHWGQGLKLNDVMFSVLTGQMLPRKWSLTAWVKPLEEDSNFKVGQNYLNKRWGLRDFGCSWHVTFYENKFNGKKLTIDSVEETTESSATDKYLRVGKWNFVACTSDDDGATMYDTQFKDVFGFDDPTDGTDDGGGKVDIPRPGDHSSSVKINTTKLSYEGGLAALRSKYESMFEKYEDAGLTFVSGVNLLVDEVRLFHDKLTESEIKHIARASDTTLTVMSPANGVSICRERLMAEPPLARSTNDVAVGIPFTWSPISRLGTEEPLEYEIYVGESDDVSKHDVVYSGLRSSVFVAMGTRDSDGNVTMDSKWERAGTYYWCVSIKGKERGCSTGAKQMYKFELQ